VKVLVRRVRRKMWGGRTDLRFYADGSSRIWVDHPSNDPAIELAMGGAILSALRDAMAEAGMPGKVGVIRWRDDPPGSPEPSPVGNAL
jgi:hypothetical protein